MASLAQLKSELAARYRDAHNRATDSEGLLPISATVGKLLGKDYLPCYKAFLDEKAEVEGWDAVITQPEKPVTETQWSAWRKALALYDVNPDVRGATIAGVDPNLSGASGIETLRQIAENIAAGLQPASLVCCGNFGTGKTGAMIAVMHRVFELRVGTLQGIPEWRYVRYGDFSREILRVLYDEHKPIGELSFSTKPILLIDDVMYSTDRTGKTEQAVFEVIDYRVSRKLSTLISTNIPPSQLRVKSEWEQWGATVDRLCDSRYSGIVNFAGESRRK